MNKYIEAMARAGARADGKDPDAPAWARFPGGPPEGICWRDQYGHKAKAALRALIKTLREDPGAVEAIISEMPNCLPCDERRFAQDQLRALADYLEGME